MWLTLAFTSAALLGLYDAAKKQSLTGNAVLPVLLLNTLFSTLLFLPMILVAECSLGWFDGTILEMPQGDLRAHALVVLKAVIVLTSWIFGLGLAAYPMIKVRILQNLLRSVRIPWMHCSRRHQMRLCVWIN